MRWLCVVLSAAVMACSALAQEDAWKALRVFEGNWQGSTSGKPGEGSTTREYRFELNGHFLYQRDRSVYQPQVAGRQAVVHEDFGMLSYDRDLKKVVWRQFHSEGLVNEYTLDAASADGKSFEFVTTRIENLPGFRAKKLYRVVTDGEIEETFLLAPPGKDFEVYTVAHLKRVK